MMISGALGMGWFLRALCWRAFRVEELFDFMELCKIAYGKVE
jgi:hypothetical protein